MFANGRRRPSPSRSPGRHRTHTTQMRRRPRHRAPRGLGPAATVGLLLLPLLVLLAAEQYAARSPDGPVVGVPASPVGQEVAAAPLATAEAKPKVREFDVVASGDILIHTSLWQQALANGDGARYDFRPMFREIRPVIRKAALAICHVETPLSDDPPLSYPIFSTPAELAEAIRWAGWDACSTASNHSVDRGQAGVDSTAAALDRAGVAHTGSFRSAEEARKVLMLEAHGVRIALLSYTSWTNGMPVPNPWSVNLIEIPRIERDAERARALGADLVFATFHWGDEYVHEPNAEQSTVATDLLRRGVVDLVLGQHAHVVQPIERIAGRFAVYGEGNLVSGMTRPESRDGLIAVIKVRAGQRGARVARVDYVPIWVARPGYVIQPVGDVLAGLQADGGGDGYEAAELRASYERTTSVVGRTRWTGPIPRSLDMSG